MLIVVVVYTYPLTVTLFNSVHVCLYHCRDNQNDEVINRNQFRRLLQNCDNPAQIVYIYQRLFICLSKRKK